MNGKKRIAIFLFLYSIVSQIYSQVYLVGEASTYVGNELAFKQLADPFTGKEDIVGKGIVDLTGQFRIQLNVNEDALINCELGVYKGHLFVEPGKTYTIAFPDKKEKTPAEKLNPFFNAIEFQFAIKGMADSDLNFKVLSFDDAYTPYFNKFAGNLYARNKKALLDSTIKNLSVFSKTSELPFFNDYVAYKIGYLRHLAYQQKSKAVSRDYFENKPVLYNNPAYIELFNQVYGKYFYFFGKTQYGKAIFDDVNKYKSYSKLVATLKRDSILLNDTLREMVVLKNIHDEFYSVNFSRSGLLNILDSLSASSKIEKHKLFAKNIRNKITRLMPGFDPPAFSLYNQDNKLVSLTDFKGQYVYLNFCVCTSYSCIKEFELLKKMSEKYKEKLAIVTIANDDSLSQMAKYVKNENLNWTFLHFANQPSVLEQYDIRAFPTYFLIGPDGKLLISPAQSPGENFEQYLFQTMRSRGDI